MRRALLAALCALLLTGCGSEPKKRGETRPSTMTKATLLSMSERSGATLVEIKDAWHQSETLCRLALVPRTAKEDAPIPAGFTRVIVPLGRAAVGSAVHAALAYDLGAWRQVAGIMDTAYVVRPALKRLLRSGRWRSLGSSSHISAELIAGIHADALLLSPYEGADYSSLRALGIPLIPCADYMETSPLGRAEWMKFYGTLFGKRATADSLWHKTQNEYYRWCRLAKQAVSHPTALLDLHTGGTWYMPAGGSTLGSLMEDAGIDYLYAGTKASGALALSPERVVCDARRATLWLLRYGTEGELSCHSLALSDPFYAALPPLHSGDVYGCNTLRSPFFEDTPFHPDRLLRDLLIIAHPELTPGGKPTYYHRLPTK